LGNETRRQVVTRYLNAAAKRDFDEMAELLTEDFTLWMVISAKERGMPYPLVGRDAFFAFIRELEKSSAKWTVETSTPLQMFFSETSVAARVRNVGRYRSGFVYDNEYVFIYRFDGDRIAEMREFTDTRYIANLTAKAMAHAS
jgi:ketosteroid isomerase-like protein